MFVNKNKELGTQYCVDETNLVMSSMTSCKDKHSISNVVRGKHVFVLVIKILIQNYDYVVQLIRIHWMQNFAETLF